VNHSDLSERDIRSIIMQPDMKEAIKRLMLIDNQLNSGNGGES